MEIPRLQETEELEYSDEVPTISYFLAGDKLKPTVLLLPGGGHMARIFYGHDIAILGEFPAHWINRLGYPVLAVSPPSDFPAFEGFLPDLTIRKWGTALAALVERKVNDLGLARKFICCGWSMAGKSVVALSTAAKDRALELEVFISLSARPPLPELSSVMLGGELLTEDGMWDYYKIGEHHWHSQVSKIMGKNGAPLIALETYMTHYLANHPIQLRGETSRHSKGKLVKDAAAAQVDMGSWEYQNYPLCAAIAPELASDMEHALTDGLIWPFLGMQSILRNELNGEEPVRMPSKVWDSLRAFLLTKIPGLTRWVPGGHFFFLGQSGARHTAEHVDTIVTEVRSIRAEVNRHLDI